MTASRGVRPRAPRSHRRAGWGAGAIAIALAAVAGCRAAPAPALHAVTIRGMRFDPPVVSAAPGDTVRWTNRDLVPHTVTARPGSFDSGNLPPDSSWTLIVRTAGEQGYACAFHPTMRGAIVVQPAGARGARSSGS